MDLLSVPRHQAALGWTPCKAFPLSTEPDTHHCKDILPIPVNRQECSPVVPDEEFMDIHWRIAFASWTPIKQVLGDNFVSPQIMDYRASDLMKVSQQDTAEMWNGAFGHKFHDNAHPRRRLGVQVFSGLCLAFSVALFFHFWWTGTSTAGISHSAVMFLAPGFLFSNIIDTLRDPNYSLFNVPMACVIPLLMVYRAFRVKLSWRGWRPTAIRSAADHKERTTERLDNLTSWRSRFVVFAVSVVIHHLLKDISLLETTLPSPQPGEYGTWAESKLLDYLESVPASLCLTGYIFQFSLNRRLGRYAGGHRLEVVFWVLGSASDLLYFVPPVVGEMQARMGLTVKPLLDISFRLPLLWQAATLPMLEPNDDLE
ncbi:hypothetical protein MIND_01085100 [Mycena indigotica]|uniref:Uncharacterized protein n=1 Tax=Mycena indigotica TaxID=2126181 RepID=A0A8H6S9S0_9AGAR|nr:uncharacterized protein MIND_01085100 [Mycena indigotica]KAF7295453.1 hypothetical protein MIND_01085100 [Mycena indigotica]